MDSYSMIPGDNLAVNYGEIVDVTINTPYDTVRKGYEIRVREIFLCKVRWTLAGEDDNRISSGRP